MPEPSSKTDRYESSQVRFFDLLANSFFPAAVIRLETPKPYPDPHDPPAQANGPAASMRETAKSQ